VQQPKRTREEEMASKENRSLILSGKNSLRLQIEEVAISTLKWNARSPRMHPEKQITMLARNIDTFGFLVPCLISDQNRLLCGNARVLAAKRLGMETVPAVRLSHLSDNDQRAFILADAKLSEHATWHPEILREEIQFFTDWNTGFDFSVIGFETAEVDFILEGTEEQIEDDPTESLRQQAISRSGDIWLVGKHRVCCGDALSARSYEAVLGRNKARLVVTDPPYNVRINGHVGGSGEIQHREFAMASGEMAPDQFASFLTVSLRHLAAHSGDGSLHYVFMDWRHCSEILGAGQAFYSELKNICVWRKANAGMGSLYRSQHELVFVFKNGTAAHVNNINLGAHGRNRSNVWDYAGINGFGRHRDELLAMHPTVKPVAMLADIIKDASHRGEVVLDAFGGSGSTLLAAERTGRRAAIIEIDPLYVDGTIRRWQALTGGTARCEATGETFAERDTSVRSAIMNING
jgi:DNA modification methylase